MRRFKKDDESRPNFVNYLKRLQPSNSKKSLQQSNSLHFNQPYTSTEQKHSKSVDDLGSFNDQIHVQPRKDPAESSLRTRKISLPMAVYPIEEQAQQSQQSQQQQASLMTPDFNQRPQRKSSLAAHSILFGNPTPLASIAQSSSSSLESPKGGSPTPEHEALLTPTSSHPTLHPTAKARSDDETNTAVSPTNTSNHVFDLDVGRDDPPSPTPGRDHDFWSQEQRTDKRSSQITLRSGFLQRKIDYMPSRKTQGELSRNWKPFKVTLRNNKLFLYKIPSSEKANAIKDFFPQRLIPSAPIQQQNPVQRSRAYYGKDKHPGLVINESASDERVIGGSPDAIVHEMIFATQSSNNDQQYEYVESVIFNYSAVLEKHFTPTRFFSEVQKCSNTALQEAPNAEYIQHVILPFIIRYLVAIQRLQLDDQGKRILINLVEAIKPRPSTQEHEDLVKTIHANLFNPRDIPSPFAPEDYQSKLRSDSSSPQVLRSEVSKHLANAGLTPALFLVLEPREIGRQVHSYHVERINGLGEYLDKHDGEDLRVRQEMFLRICQQAEDSNPLLLLSFSPAKPHFLTRLILHHVLILSRQPLNLEGISSLGQLRSLVAATTSSPTALRATLIVHWIRVGMSLERLGDAAGWAAVALGLCSRAVSRLSRTWKRIGRDERNTVSRWAATLADLGVVDEAEITTEAKVKPATSIPNYTIPPKSKVRPAANSSIHVTSAAIPYLGTLLDDVKPTLDAHSTDEIQLAPLYRSRRRLYEAFALFEESYLGQNVKIDLNHKSSRDTVGTATNDDDDNHTVGGREEDDDKVLTSRCAALLVEFGALWQYLSLIPIPQLPQISLYIGNSLSCESRLLNAPAERKTHKTEDSIASASPALATDYKPPTQLLVHPLTPLTFPPTLSYVTFSDAESIAAEANEKLYAQPSKPKMSRLDSTDSTKSAQTTLPTPTPQARQLVRTHSLQLRRRSFDMDLKRKPSRRAIKNEDGQSPVLAIEKAAKNIHEPQNRRLAFQRTMKEMAAGGAETLFNLCDGELVIKALPNESFFVKRFSVSHRLSVATSASGQTKLDSPVLPSSARVGEEGSRPTSLIESRATSRHASVSNFCTTTGTTGALGRAASVRRQSLIGTPSQRYSNYSNFSSNHSNEAYLRVHVKSGNLDRLIDVLILGIDHLGVQRTSADDMGGGLEVSSAGKGKIKFAMDLTEYADVFFATFRSICLPLKLFEVRCYNIQVKPSNTRQTLQKRFECAPNVSPELSLVASEVHFPTWKSERIPVDEIEWEQVTRVRVGVIDALRFWLEFGGGLQDALDEQALFSGLYTFLKDAQTLTQERHVSEDQLSSLQTTQRAMQSLYDFFVRQALRPDLLSNNEGPSESLNSDIKPEGVLEGDQSSEPAPEDKAVPESKTRDILEAATVVENMDNSSAEEIVEALDQIGSAILRNISEQDLVATAELFETQVNENDGWFASKSQDINHNSSQENLPIQDIYTYISIVKGEGDVSIARRLPASVRAAHKATMIVRKWATNMISQVGLGLEARSKRIEIMLDAITICRSRMTCLNGEDISMRTGGTLSSSMASIVPSANDVSGSTIKSMVEGALVAALVTPESRSHVGTWTKVADNRSADIQSLQTFIKSPDVSESDRRKSGSSLRERERPCAVDLGWIWERMLEVILDVRDDENLIGQFVSFDKRRYLFNFSCNAPQLGQQNVLSSEDEGSISFLLQLMDKQSNELIPRLQTKDSEHSIHKHVHEDASREVIEAQTKDFNVEHTYAFAGVVKLQQEKEKRDATIIERMRREKRDDLAVLEKRETEIQKAASMSFLSRHSRTTSSTSTASVGSTNTAKKSRQGKRMTALLRPFRPLSIAFGSSQHTPSETPRKRLSELDFEPSNKPALVVTLHAARVSEFVNNARSYTFQIVSEDGANYLFQATSASDVKEWIDVVSRASQSSAAKRLTYIAPNATSASDLQAQTQQQTQAPAVSGKREPQAVFGVDLSEVVRREHGDEGIENGDIPILIDKCLNEIEKRGLLETGIYRLSGAISSITNLKDAFDSDASAINLSEGDARDVHSVTGILKLYLRELPEPVVPYAMYPSFIQAVLIEEYEERLYAIRELVWNLPRTHFTLLRRLAEHLEKVTDFEDQNQMFAHNLAIVFGPNILKPPAGPGNFMASMSNIGHVSNLVKIFILQCHWLFYAADEADADNNENNNTTEQSQPTHKENDDTVIVEEDEDAA
ncbi:hypothetical protein E3P92_00350 [Wallemia ichthyophaga]|nr:hypothetical protein E3P92_00350 [Wallemia ichthyophaga]